MPLIQSGTGGALEQNFKELRQGPLFKNTMQADGSKTAIKQMQAIALSNQRKYIRKPSVKRPNTAYKGLGGK